MWDGIGDLGDPYRGATSVDHNRSRFMLEAAKPARLVAELFTQSYNFWMTHVKKGPNIKD